MANMLQASRDVPGYWADEADGDGGKTAIRRRARARENRTWQREAWEDLAALGYTRI